MSGQSSKSPSEQAVFSGEAFSLIELLTVTALIGLLAALILPALAREKTQAKKQRARLEMAQIISALTAYETVYGQFPVSAEVADSAALMEEDMTYGGIIQETHTWLAGPCYMTDNSELMAGLLDLDYFGDGTPTVNSGHVQNPQRTKFLDASMHGGTNAAPGVGADGLYRDPWGSPYIVTLDLNGDGRARDVMYRQGVVAEDAQNPGRGLHGLIAMRNVSGRTVYEAPARVLVWSAGPDRHLSNLQKADQGVNRDNILSWSR
ncbi:MAG TPA: hypothetical protein VJA21_24615 [Verrucomicrobiae bacterium]